MVGYSRRFGAPIPFHNSAIISQTIEETGIGETLEFLELLNNLPKTGTLDMINKEIGEVCELKIKGVLQEVYPHKRQHSQRVDFGLGNSELDDDTRKKSIS